MRLDLVIAVLVLAAGLAVSALLLPRGGEIALMRFRDQDFDMARTIYEGRYAGGDRSAGTVMPLTRLHLADGDVDGAIALMEAYVAAEPEKLESRLLLGTYYRYALRLGDYLDNLEIVARLRPDEAVYRELAAAYAYHGWYDRQAEALKHLVALVPKDIEAASALGQLLAARGRLDEAAEELAAADDRAKGELDNDSRILLLSLLIDRDKMEEANRRARRWLEGDPPGFLILALTGTMSEGGRIDDAYRLLAPFTDRVRGDPAMALTLIDLETASGHAPEAARLLKEWKAARPIDDSWLGHFVASALNVGLGDLALAVTNDRRLELIPEWTLPGLAEAALRARDMPFLDHMRDELGAAFLEARPMLGAEIAIARADPAGAAAWAQKALAQVATPVAERIMAIVLLSRVDRPAEARAAFAKLSLDHEVPEDALDNLAQLYLSLGEAKRGLGWFAATRKTHPSTAAETGWARLAAAVGDPAEVAVWLDAHPRLDDAVLQDIASAALERGGRERGAAVLALNAGRRLLASAPTPGNRLLLASAEVAAGRARDALPALRDLLSQDRGHQGRGRAGRERVEPVYLAALEAAGEIGELTGYLDQRMKSGTLSAQDEERILYQLLDLKAYRAALPLLGARARDGGAEWLFAYADAAAKAGAGRELAAFLTAELARPDQPQAWLAERAQLLIETDAKAAAPPLAALAERDPERWWEMAVEAGRRAGDTRAIVALLDRLARQPGVSAKTRDAMAFALLDLGGPAMALPLLRELATADPQGDPQGPWDSLTREALTKLGRRPELKAYLAARARDERLPARVRREAATALLAEGDKAGAEAALRQLALAEGPKGETLAQLLYLWGPRPKADALGWLEARARAAKAPAEQAAWWDLLAGLGGSKRVLAAMEGAGPDAPRPDVLGISYIEALAAAGRKNELGEAIRAAVATERDPERLRRLAALAERAGRKAAEEEAWKALSALLPDDPEALRRLGFLAYDSGRMEMAERALGRYLDISAGDWEANFFLGEAATSRNHGADALVAYRRGLARIQALDHPDAAAKRGEAAMLARVGRVDEASALYAALLRERPDDRQLKADYVGMLLENRRVKEAGHVLDAR